MRLPFAVDNFHPTYPLPQAYFLSHAHTDHFQGITTCKSPIYCTYQTANLASFRLNLPMNKFHVLPLSIPQKLPHTTFTVTLLPTVHCAGACMFLFESPQGTILHTGDFRATQSVIHSLSHLTAKLDLILLDSTYCNPRYNFSSLSTSTANFLSLCDSLRLQNPHADIVIVVDLLGKEELLHTLSLHLKQKLLVTSSHMAILQIIYPSIAHRHFISSIYPPVTKSLPAVRAIPFRALTARNRRQHARIQTCMPVFITPTAFEKRVSKYSVHVSYSRHSSFQELYTFVKTLQPKRIQPTAESIQSSRRDGIPRDPNLFFHHLLHPSTPPSSPQVKRKAKLCSAADIFAKASAIKAFQRLQFED